MKAIVITIIFFSYIYTTPVYSQDKDFIQDQNADAVLSDEEVESIILFGEPSELKSIIRNKIDANKIYQCNTPLTLSIRGALAIHQIGENAPIYAIEKMKYVIDMGADLNKETCAQNARYPLVLVLTLPLELQGYADMSSKAIDQALKNGSGDCNIPGVISKPCKDITEAEISQLKDVVNQSFFDAGADTSIRNNEGVMYYDVIGIIKKPSLQDVIDR